MYVCVHMVSCEGLAIFYLVPSITGISSGSTVTLTSTKQFLQVNT